MPAPITTLRAGPLTVRIYSDDASLADDAAAQVAAYLRDRILEQGEASVIWATGNSQLVFLEKLFALPKVDWDKVTCFHLDEYLGLGDEHPSSFRAYLWKRVEKPAHPKMFHYLEGDSPEPIKECDRYEKLLRQFPADLCLLGIGNNGHLGFNEPSVADFEDKRWVKVVALDEVNRRQQVSQGHFPDLPSVPRHALTLTLPAILAAKRLVCLAPGAGKADIVDRTIHGPIGPDCPSTALRVHDQAALYLDRDSAAHL